MCCRCWYDSSPCSQFGRVFVRCCPLMSLSLCRTMLTKDKKPDEKDQGKEMKEVIPPRPDTPQMFKAALKVTKQAGIEGTFAKLRETYKTSESSEVRVQ